MSFTGFIIALSGYAGVGKDQIADYLISNYAWNRKTAFSKNLKYLCKLTFKFTDEQLNTQSGKKTNLEVPIIFSKIHFSTILMFMLRTHPNAANQEAKQRWIKALKAIPEKYFGIILYTPREAIQFVGTVCRELCESYHVDILLKDILSTPEQKIIVPDVRYENEAEAILSLPNHLIINVIRENLPDLNMNRKHTSETTMQNWKKFDDTIYIPKENDSIKFLYSEIDALLERHKI